LLCGGDGCQKAKTWRGSGFGSGGIRNVIDTGGIKESDSF
jgi:hypothetical protein